ncbi:hypothetical protein QBC42DRAFT_303701 [Cladorrhinum samala]|uniref:Microbial-type PARG catalytic domain-containing protein n=1 Tax=Cladorrhinum samala TaxID=585594 RepID=A0AAV9I0Y5_9PEZI|nr:hypothetical protein QBC42DRAFT_303701 [Cladorrhinum samala]
MPFGSKASQARRAALAAIAAETLSMTPSICASLPHLSPAAAATPFSLSSLAALDPSKSPCFPPAPIRVLPSDSFEAAISMPPAVLIKPGSTVTTFEAALKAAARNPANVVETPLAARVAVLNMASEKNPGGGWLRGASAQEEALCYRSTLASSLDGSLYPIAPRAGLYTRDVVIFRTSSADGHRLLTATAAAAAPEELPVVSVISVAGIRRPEVVRQSKEDGGGGRGGRGEMRFKHEGSRVLTMDKMRLCLRMAGTAGHTMLVLGALGCGAFRNPVQEVARSWREVLGEDEFRGWFKEVWFAVLDRRGEGNLEVFREVLEGRAVAEGAGEGEDEGGKREEAGAGS